MDFPADLISGPILSGYVSIYMFQNTVLTSKFFLARVGLAFTRQGGIAKMY